MTVLFEKCARQGHVAKQSWNCCVQVSEHHYRSDKCNCYLPFTNQQTTSRTLRGALATTTTIRTKRKKRHTQRRDSIVMNDRRTGTTTTMLGEDEETRRGMLLRAGLHSSSPLTFYLFPAWSVLPFPRSSTRSHWLSRCTVRFSSSFSCSIRSFRNAH